MQEFNRFKLLGELMGIDKLTGVIRTIGHGARGAKFEDEHVVNFATEQLANLASKCKYLTIIGMLTNNDLSDTFLKAGAITKAAKKDPNVNIAKLVGRVHSYEFFPPSQGKRQFGSLTLNCCGQFVTVTAFRGLASYLNEKATLGTGIEVVGRNRASEFEDSEGNIRASVDIVADGTRTKIVAPSNQRDHFEDMQEVAMAFDEGIDDDTAPLA